MPPVPESPPPMPESLPLPPSPDEDCAVLRRALLGDLAAQGLRPAGARLLLLAGLPGSGKSHLARELAARHPFLTLETDRLRKLLAAQPQYTPEEHRRVFDSCHRLIEEFLRQDYSVIFDATNLTEGFRAPLYEIGARRGCPVALAVVRAAPGLVRRRLEARASGGDPATYSDAGWAVYRRMAPAWEPPQRRHYVVDSGQDIGPAVRMLAKWAAAPPDSPTS